MNVLCYVHWNTTNYTIQNIWYNVLACVHCISLFSYVNSYESFLWKIRRFHPQNPKEEKKNNLNNNNSIVQIVNSTDNLTFLALSKKKKKNFEKNPIKESSTSKSVEIKLTHK